MIRLIIDKLGGGHDDLFLKIDPMPSYSKIADSYYLLDFLEISDTDLQELNLTENETLKYKAAELLRYWINRIKQIGNGQKTFIPFDLSDEYVSGLMFEKTKLGFKTKIVYTDKIHGYAVGKSNLDNQIENNKIEFIEEEHAEWLVEEDELFGGLDWSIRELTSE